MRTGLSHEEDRVQESATTRADGPVSHSVRTGTDTIRKKLREVLRGIETAPLFAAGEYEIQQVACDSRKVRRGARSFALHGPKSNGNALIQDPSQRCLMVL